jgi:hypothetical protein
VSKEVHSPETPVEEGEIDLLLTKAYMSFESKKKFIGDRSSLELLRSLLWRG